MYEKIYIYISTFKKNFHNFTAKENNALDYNFFLVVRKCDSLLQQLPSSKLKSRINFTKFLEHGFQLWRLF